MNSMKQIKTVTLNLPKTYVQSSYCNPENNFKPKIWNKLLASVHLMQCQYLLFYIPANHIYNSKIW